MLYRTQYVGEGLKIAELELQLLSVDHDFSEVTVSISEPHQEGSTELRIPVGGNPLIFLGGDLELHVESISHGMENAKFGLHAPNGHLPISFLDSLTA